MNDVPGFQIIETWMKHGCEHVGGGAAGPESISLTEVPVRLGESFDLDSFVSSNRRLTIRHRVMTRSKARWECWSGPRRTTPTVARSRTESCALQTLRTLVQRDGLGRRECGEAWQGLAEVRTGADASNQSTRPPQTLVNAYRHAPCRRTASSSSLLTWTGMHVFHYPGSLGVRWGL